MSFVAFCCPFVDTNRSRLVAAAPAAHNSGRIPSVTGQVTKMNHSLLDAPAFPDNSGAGSTADDGPVLSSLDFQQPEVTISRRTLTQIHLFSALFWLGMFVMDTTQMALTRDPQDWRTGSWNAAQNLFGLVLCLPLGWVIRRTLNRSVKLRLLAIGAACVPAAAIYAVAGHVIWIHILGTAASKRFSTVISIAIQSHYYLVFFMLWSAFCAAILYSAQVQERERSLLQARALAHEAELKMLRYQINPHFLFNTLNAVSALIVTGQTLAAEAMVGKLARFFRTALSRESSAKVTLTEDVRVQLEYLSIELLRFPDRLSWSVHIEPALTQALVPHLILQPLFENAIKHGVARSKGPVEIRLSAIRDGNSLMITMDNEARRDSGEPRGEHVGLLNVERRLAAFYGSQASMHVTHTEDRFSVSLRLPLEVTL